MTHPLQSQNSFLIYYCIKQDLLFFFIEQPDTIDWLRLAT